MLWHKNRFSKGCHVQVEQPPQYFIIMALTEGSCYSLRIEVNKLYSPYTQNATNRERAERNFEAADLASLRSWS